MSVKLVSTLEWKAISSAFVETFALAALTGTYMPAIEWAIKAMATRILEGPGKASPSERQSAFNNCGLIGAISTLVEKTAVHASSVTDEDVVAATASGISEDAVFEIVVCAAVGQATRQYEAALAALKAATGEA